MLSTENFNFDNIRSFRDEEVHDKLLDILDDEGFIYILKKLYSDERIAHLSKELYRVNSVYDFQKRYISEFVNALLQLTVSDFKVSGLENLKPDTAYLFISNHRDIILDSTLINHVLLNAGHKTSEIAIGNNLLIHKWINVLVRLNKSFIVRRDLKGKEMLIGSQKLSAYIRDTIVNRNTSVWIAQREGRTKNGIDKTDPAILKMINMSGCNNFTDSFSEVNIVPVSVSYENEPTIESKIAATFSKKTGEKYTKTQEEDLKDMGRGLYSMKGKVNIVFGKPVNEDLKSIEKIKKRNEKFSTLAERIDNEIYKNYVLTKPNYIAFDILTGSKKFFKENKYIKAEETKLRMICKKTIDSIDGDKIILEKIFYGLYSNPLISKIKL
ncbi:MAG: 1-acyl-sn-glycerol-3-phosphate acyltransferase [Bacteroidales bacterium]|nr:1-acyl-sn-glycerol-3-phosphate acyltransferase [Bacteroidales bacterium]